MSLALRYSILSCIAWTSLLAGCGGDSSESASSVSSATTDPAAAVPPKSTLGLARVLPGNTTTTTGAGSSSGSSSSGASSTSSSSGGSFATTMWNAATFASHGVRGFNQPGDFTAKSFSDMAATGANVARVFVLMTMNASQSAYAFNLSDVDTALTAGTQEGFKVVIVFVPVTTSSVAEYWSNPNLQASLQANWVATAAKYNGNPTVAGYDLINEPSAPGGESQWQTFALQLISAIRNVDASHVIIFEPSPGGVPEAFAGLTPLDVANLVYSVHWYEPYGFTNQGLQTQVAVSYPSAAGSALGVVDESTLSSKLAPVRQFATNSGAPVYVGEFSAVRWAPGTSSYNYVRDSIALFEVAGWSWNYHEWRGYPGWDAELPESWFAQFQMVNALPQGWENANVGAARTDTTDTMTLLKGYFELNTH